MGYVELEVIEGHKPFGNSGIMIGGRCIRESERVGVVVLDLVNAAMVFKSARFLLEAAQ